MSEVLVEEKDTRVGMVSGHDGLRLLAKIIARTEIKKQRRDLGVGQTPMAQEEDGEYSCEE